MDNDDRYSLQTLNDLCEADGVMTKVRIGPDQAEAYLALVAGLDPQRDRAELEALKFQHRRRSWLERIFCAHAPAWALSWIAPHWVAVVAYLVSMIALGLCQPRVISALCVDEPEVEC